jgi:hypothetical protein
VIASRAASEGLGESPISMKAEMRIEVSKNTAEARELST